MTPEQIEYVKGELAKGLTPEAVKQTLRGSGYNEELIVQIFNAAGQGLSSSTVVPTPQPIVVQKKSSSVLKIILIVIGVIVIIFVLLGITVFSSLNSARDKAADATAKATIHNLRAMGELYFDSNNNSYAGWCTSDDVTKNVYSNVKIDCEDSATSYRVSTVLKNGEYYCADTTGSAKNITIPPSGLRCL